MGWRCWSDPKVLDYWGNHLLCARSRRYEMHSNALCIVEQRNWMHLLSSEQTCRLLGYVNPFSRIQLREYGVERMRWWCTAYAQHTPHQFNIITVVYYIIPLCVIRFGRLNQQFYFRVLFLVWRIGGSAIRWLGQHAVGLRSHAANRHRN